jgi:hypothetical protein
MAAALEGLALEGRAVTRPELPGFCLLSFARGDAAWTLERRSTGIRGTVEEWEERFRQLDAWLGADERPLTVWGLGQTFSLFLAYTTLREGRVRIGYDDNPDRFRGAFGFGVERLEDAPEPEARVLVTFAPSARAVARLDALGLDWYSPFP